MDIKSFVTIDTTGKVYPGAKAHIYTRAGTAASIFNRAGQPIINPIVSNLVNGFFEFSAKNGDYDIQFELQDGSKGVKFAVTFIDLDTINETVNDLKTDVDSFASDIATNANEITTVKTSVSAQNDFNVTIKNPTGFSVIGSFESVAALRASKPSKEGVVVNLKGYRAGSTRGAGQFIGHLGKVADDKGIVIGDSNTFYWTRIFSNLSEITIYDFGAYGDGTTDDQPACIAMYESTYSAYVKTLCPTSPKNGIRFEAGKYFLSPGDYSKYGGATTDTDNHPSGFKDSPYFSLLGPHVLFGVQPLVELISDKSITDVFKLNHRRTIIDSIQWDGQQTIKQNSYNKETNPTGTNMLIGATQKIFNDVASNTQPFLQNVCAGGQYVNVYGFRSINTGNYTLLFLDTLDCRIDQIYGSMTAGPVVIAGWSNRKAGVWDHSTAMELTNANFQKPCAPAIWAPRMGQGIMRNVWFEHGNVPMDINNSQWLLDAVSIEDCTKNACTYNGRMNIRQLSTPTGNKLDFETSSANAEWPSYDLNPDGSAITAFLSDTEQGYIRTESFGSIFNSPVKMQWESGILRGGWSSESSAKWVNIGLFDAPTTGQQWEITILAKNGYNGLRASPRPILDGAPGKSVINIQRGNGSSPILTLSHEGYNGVLAAQYQAQFNNLVTVWVNIAGYCGEYSIYVKGTGLTRYEAGNCSRFRPNGTYSTSSPGQTTITRMFSKHNGSAGIGAYDSVLAIDSTGLTNSQVSSVASASFVKIKINGVDYAMPVFGIIPVITTQPVAQTIAAGAALTLSVVANDAKSYQWQKDQVNIAGATSATYTKASSVAGDSGSYRVIVSGQGPVDNTTTSTAVAVTVS